MSWMFCFDCSGIRQNSLLSITYEGILANPTTISFKTTWNMEL